MLNCIFTDNHAADDGGGMNNRGNSSPTVINCTFTGNTAQEDGGGMRNRKSTACVIDCTFSQNVALLGGGIYNDISSILLSGCTFSGNLASDGAGIFNDDTGRVTGAGDAISGADAFVNVEAVRLTAWEAAWLLSEGRPADDEIVIAKYWAAEGGQFVAYACQHLHGGIGIDVDYPLHRYFLWAIQNEHTFGGASAQLAALGERIAAAPR